MMQSQKCSIKWLRHGADVPEWQYTNLEGLAFHIPNLNVLLFVTLFLIIIIIITTTTIATIILLET